MLSLPLQSLWKEVKELGEKMSDDENQTPQTHISYLISWPLLDKSLSSQIYTQGVENEERREGRFWGFDTDHSNPLTLQFIEVVTGKKTQSLFLVHHLLQKDFLLVFGLSNIQGICFEWDEAGCQYILTR